jgi:hypothetical protein
VEVRHKTSKNKNEESSEDGSTDEDIAFSIRKYKKFLKSKASQKGGDERNKKSQSKSMSVESMHTSLSSVPRTRMRKRISTRKRAKSTRTSTKGMPT